MKHTLSAILELHKRLNSRVESNLCVKQLGKNTSLALGISLEPLHRSEYLKISPTGY